jgi:hypothetical protein
MEQRSLLDRAKNIQRMERQQEVANRVNLDIPYSALQLGVEGGLLSFSAPLVNPDGVNGDGVFEGKTVIVSGKQAKALIDSGLAKKYT